MIRTASPDDLPALRELFARANDTPYDLAAVAEEKCFGEGVAGEPVVRVVERDGTIAGAAVTCGKWLRILAVDRLARRQGIGSALVTDAESRGAIIVGAEPGNYFTPGVFAGDEGTNRFFHVSGYVEMRWTWTLEVDVRHQIPDGSSRRPRQDEADRVLEFIEREFGRIWRFEASRAFDPDEPTIFITEEGGAIAGFAAHDINNRGLGFFGPAGVAKSMRGRRIGCNLVVASLADLHRMGYQRAVIPWTEALGFYRKCGGAEPAHRFVTFGLDSAP